MALPFSILSPARILSKRTAGAGRPKLGKVGQDGIFPPGQQGIYL
jgi:hypothetical protein